MYARFSRRLCQAYVSSSCSRGNRYVSPSSTSCQRFLEITFNRPSGGNLTRTLYSLNIFYREMASGKETCKDKKEKQYLPTIKYKDLLKDLQDPEVLVIDVREPFEIKETGKMEESIHIPMDDVKNALVNLSEEEFLNKYRKPKPTLDTKIIFTCQSGGRSKLMQKCAKKIGYTRVYNYEDGWLEWQKHQGESGGKSG